MAETFARIQQGARTILALRMSQVVVEPTHVDELGERVLMNYFRFVKSIAVDFNGGSIGRKTNR